MVNRPSLARFSPYILASACSIAFIAPPPLAHAQESEVKNEVENSRFQFEGEINANSTFIHSGPSDMDYATMRLDRGSHVTVVGIRFDWLKIAPPPGSFCYVAKAFIERRENGSIGRVTNPLIVHYGSDLTPLTVKNAKRLEAGADVEILGDNGDEYFRIKPPAGVYVYVKKEFVTPLHAIAAATPDQQDGTSTPPAVVIPPTKSDDVASNSTTQPAIAGTASTQPAVAMGATTQPDSAAAQAEFEKLEADFASEAAKPLEDQKPAALSAGYDKVAKGGALPDSLRKIAEYKAAMLKVHADDQKEFLAVKKQQDEANARMASLKAERQELEVRAKNTEVKSYTAVGTLRPSSLQQGQSVLFRLTDPASGRTVLYVRSNDPKVGSMVNQFVGVTGGVVDDATLSVKLIEPTGMDVVDQAKLYKSVMAQIIPPSLAAVGQASTGQ